MPENEKLELIVCPYCGAQYLPVEIYLPNVFFGRPKHVERNAKHKIIDIVGSYGNNVEHYKCDFCNKPFRVTAKVQYTTKREDKFDFDSDYSTKLRKNTLFLDEE